MARTVHSLTVRALIVGGGRRALALAHQLTSEGHAVRVVTRTEDREPAIRAVGAEPWRGDPDRVGTLRYALDNVTVLLWLLGTATGPPDKVAALHGSRLEMMLERTIDTTVRGFVYEAGPPEGVAVVERMASYNEIPFRIVRPGDDLRAAVDGLLSR